VRDGSTGECRRARLTVREYFRTLGVDHLFSPAEPDSLRQMQYAAINPLGFVGYQIGEAILAATGFYAPPRVERRGEACDRYYVGSLPAGTWRDGRREAPVSLPGRGEIVATDVNTWRGTFNGRYGIHSLDDLRSGPRQEYVIRDLMDFNRASIEAVLSQSGSSLARELSVPRSVPVTMSGVLAAAHLCGAEAVVAYLHSGADAADEFGTRLSRYLAALGGYDTPYFADGPA